MKVMALQDIKRYLSDRRRVKPRTVPHIKAWLVDYSMQFQKNKKTALMGEKLALYVRELDMAKGFDEKRHAIFRALDFLEGCFARDRLAGKVIDFRGFEPGDFLDDGTLLDSCPACGQTGMVSDDLDLFPQTIHTAKISIVGYEARETCDLQAGEPV